MLNEFCTIPPSVFLNSAKLMHPYPILYQIKSMKIVQKFQRFILSNVFDVGDEGIEHEDICLFEWIYDKLNDLTDWNVLESDLIGSNFHLMLSC